MLRTHLPLPIALLTLLLAPSVAPASEPEKPESTEHEEEVESVYRVYDVSDVLPPAAHEFDDSAGLVLEVGVWIGFTLDSLGPDLVTLVATPDEHDRFVEAMDELRATYGERFVISVHALRLDADEQAGVGDQASELDGELVFEQETVGRRGAPVEVSIAREIHYIADINPIVGSSSAAGDPTIDVVGDGVFLTARVDDSEGGVSRVRLSGEMRSVEMRDAEVEVAAADTTQSARFQLPEIKRTPIESSLLIPAGRPTIVAIASDPVEPSERIALIVEHRRLR